MFEASFNGSVDQYETSLRAERTSGHIDLLNDNFDTGSVTGPGQYPLADKTYADLLDRLAKQNFQQVSPALQAAILDFYGDLQGPFTTKKDKKEWPRIVEEVGDLRAFTPAKTGIVKAPKSSYQPFPTVRLLVTEKTFGTVLA